MKKQFQSKSVPQGTRTIWRYLSAFIILFTFAIGNVMADPTLANTDIPSSALDISSVSTTKGTLDYLATGTSSSKTYYVFGIDGIRTSYKSDASNVPWAYCKATDGGGTQTISYATSLTDADKVGFVSSNNTCAGINSGRYHCYRVKACTSITVLHRSNGTNSEKRIWLNVFKYNTLSSSFEFVEQIKADYNNSADIVVNASLNASDEYVIQVTSGSTSNSKCYQVRFYSASSGSDPVAVTGITITPSPASVKVGKTKTLSATVTPNDATDKAVTWAVTSGGTYASVNATTGVVTGLAEGTAVITATAHDGSGVTQTVTVNVSACPTSGTIYKFQLKTDLTNGNLTTSVPQDVVMTTENYLSNLTGGTLTAAARSNVNRIYISNGNAIGFANGDQAFLKMDLDCAIQEGDILKYTITSNDMILMAGSETEATNRMTLSRNVAQVEVDSKLVGADALYMKRSSSSPKISYFEVFRPVYNTITLEYADGVTPDGTIKVLDGTAATKPADPTWEHHRFDGWYAGSDLYDWSTTVSGDFTLTAHWTQLYTVTYAKGDESATGDAPTQADKAATETFKVAANTFELAGKVFDHWNDGTADYDPEDTYTVGTSNVTLTAIWRTPSTMYAITKGDHDHGDFTIDPASQEAGEVVTLAATPDDGYLFGAWEVVKTEDASATGITVDANGQFTMPGYAVTVNATFVADPRKKILYVTNNDEATTKANDKLYAALKDDYRISIVSYGSDADQTNYDLVVLHESIGGGNYGATAVAAAKAGNTPVLNTKSYFYNDGRWGWGAPNAGQSVKGATMNSSYCNIADHPLFSGVTVSEGFFEITDDAAAKCMQPVGSFTSGKEGYTLATTPNNGEGNGCAIHELTPAQRGASAGKYLMISVSGDKLNALNANGQKLFQNAAAYLIGSSTWTPVIAPTLSSSVPANSAIDVAVAGNIVLTFSENVTVLDASKFTLTGGAGSLTTASISVSGAAVTIPYTGLDNSTEYTLATAAGAVKNGSDVPNAALSNIVFTTEAACTKPGAPASLVASDIAYTSATLSWDPSGAGTNGYEISIIKKDDETVILDWTYEATNSYEATGLTQGTEYTFKIKYKGDGITPGQCEFSNEVTVDFTTTAPSVADLVTIADDYTFTPSATIAAGTLAESNKFFGAGTDDCDYGSGMRVKENRALAFKVNNGARVKVTFTTNGDREMQLGTDKADDDNKAYGHTKTSPATFDVTADGVVYLTASSDLRFSKLEIMYPHTVTYDLNGGTGTTPTQASKYVGETFSVHDGVTDITAPASKDFDKWVDQDAADVAAGATYTMPAKNVTLTAQWVDHIEPVDPTLTYDDGAYSVGGSALDLSSLITAQTSTGAITYSVKTDGGTSASIDGNNFTATAAGTATITASQAAVVGFNAKSVDFNVVVTEPTEKDGIKMVVAGVLTGNFRVKADQLKTGSYTVDGINYTKYVQMGSTHTSFGGETEGTQTKGIYYAPTKKNITFWFYMRNTESSTTRKIYVYTIEEGKEITSKTVDVEAGSHLVSTDITLTTNAEIVFGVENTKLYFCQIVAVESGEDLLQGGQNGYVFDYSKKRQNVAANTLRTIDGIDYKLSAESKINSASNVQLTTLGTHYIKFHLDAPMTVNVYADNKKYYVGTECSTEDAAMTYEATGDGEFTLAAGNWYINGSGAQVKINKLSFALPKAEAPTITTQPATCHTFDPGDMTATVVAEVSDGGTLSYQWYNASDDSEVDGATAATLTTTTEGRYYVIVTNSLAGHQDNSTKSNEAELGYRVTDDATLSALSASEGTLDPAFDPAEENYRIDLAKGTTIVPTLSATATMDGYANVAINNAAEFVNYEAVSTVVVTSEDLTETKTYTVHFYVAHTVATLVDVTENTTWDWSLVTKDANNADITSSGVIVNESESGLIIASYLMGDNFDKIEGNNGAYAIRNGSDKKVYQGANLHFHSTVGGYLSIWAANEGHSMTLNVANEGRDIELATLTGSQVEYKVYVKAGDVVIYNVPASGTSPMRVQKIVFTVDETPDYTRNVSNNIGTLCVDHNVLVGGALGATFYQIAGTEPQYGKIVFDEVTELVAGEPYIFQSTTGRIDLFYGATVADDPVAVNGMIGSFVDFDLPITEANKADIMYIANNRLWNCEDLSKLEVMANRCYIDYSQVSPVSSPNPAPGRRRIGISGAPQIATGCENINAADKPVKMIIDGQMYILRGEKMYDATGRLVK